MKRGVFVLFMVFLGVFAYAQTADVEYRVYQGGRPTQWEKNGVGSGSLGTTVEAIEIRLTGRLADRYHVEYRVYQSGRPTQWERNGVGSGGLGTPVEAIEVKLLRK
jgi:hypothetical protein